MYDFNERLEELVSKFGIHVEIPEAYDYIDMYSRYVAEFIDTCKKLKGKRVGVYGLNLKTMPTLELVDWTKELDVVCFIDNDEKKRAKFMVKYDAKGLPFIPVISSDKIAEHNAEAVLILNFNSRKAIKEHLKELYPNIVSYDVYEILEEKGLFYKKEFFQGDPPRAYECLLIHKYVYSYMTAPDLKDKKRLLEAVIYMHIGIRDFYNVDLFIRDYIFLGFDKINKYAEFSKELRLLFDEMFEVSGKKTKSNIAVIVIDCLDNVFYQHMPFVKSLMRDKGVVFENAYSNASWTTSSHHSILSGKDIIQGGLYKDENLNEDCLGKLKDIKNEGYEVRAYGYVKSVLETFYPPKNPENPLLEKFEKDQSPLSLLLWNFICDYLKDDEKSFSILHALNELHEFFNCLYRNYVEDASWKNGLVETNLEKDAPLTVDSSRDFSIDESSIFDRINERRLDGAQFIDCQLEFYLKLININLDTLVIMGDHGVGARFGSAYRPFFGVACKKLTPGINSKLFSYIDIIDMLYNFCIGIYDIKPYERDYVYCSDYPIYGLDFFVLTLRNLNFDMSKLNTHFYGVCHIVTYTDRYSYFFNGTESYTLISDENTNLIDDERFAVRISELKSKLGKIDTAFIYAQKKFDETRDILLGTGDVKKLVNEGCELFSIAFEKRMRELLPLRPESYRKPINF